MVCYLCGFRNCPYSNYYLGRAIASISNGVANVETITDGRTKSVSTFDVDKLNLNVSRIMKEQKAAMMD